MSSWRGILLLLPLLPSVMEGHRQGRREGCVGGGAPEGEEGGVFGVDSGFKLGGEVRRRGYELLGKGVVMHSFGASGDVAGSG